MSKEDRVLVTGGSGFMGTRLIQGLLDDSINVVNVDIKDPLNSGHKKYWVNLDILDKDKLIELFHHYKPTHVVHLAARTDLEETKDIKGYAVNVEGVENVVLSIATTPSVERAIITSTMLVCRIGYTPKSDEDYSTSTVYGESKVLTEKITRKLDPPCVWTIIRPTTIWGPYHKGMENAFFTVLRKGLYVHPGHQRCLRSYGYVGNSIFEIRKILDAPKELVYRKTLYISDLPIDLKDWTEGFSQKILGREVRVLPRWIMWIGASIGDLFVKMGMKKFPLTTFRLKNMTTESVLDVGPIMEISGKLPYSMSEGIEETVVWLNRGK